LVIFAIVALSVLPAVIESLREWSKLQRAKTAGQLRPATRKTVSTQTPKAEP